jgi:hypothetical protein
MLIKLKQNTPEWLEWRKRKITGTKSDMAPLSGSLPKKAFFNYVAEISCSTPENETDIERGNRLEPIARALISEKLDKKLSDDYVIEGDNNTGLSPDALVVTELEPTVDLITEAVEIKCLNSANHLEALYINRAFNNDKKVFPRSSFLVNYGVPSSYVMQVYSYFIQLPKLETLYFSLYNENAPLDKQLYILPIKRTNIEDELEKHNVRLNEMINEAKSFVDWLEF